MEYWKISDFAKVVGKHQNTIDGWFKQLEELKIHSVNRNETGDKIYTSLDLQIAKYIVEKRKEKWALEFIFQELPKMFELRPVEERESTSVPQTIVRQEFETVAKELFKVQMNEMRKYIEEVATAQASELKEQYDSLIKQLPKPKTLQEERQERINEMITRRRIESVLEREALHLWSTKPDNERKIKIGLFRKEEDRDKRDLFVKEYVNEHFASRIKDEYRIE